MLLVVGFGVVLLVLMTRGLLPLRLGFWVVVVVVVLSSHSADS